AAANAILPDVIALRRRIHRHPEIGLDLPLTQAIIVEELTRLGLEPRTGKALSSVTAVIGADRPGRTIVLRGDMDGLPLTEETGLEFASEVERAMHACGHDTHVAMLLGGARLLVDAYKADPSSLPGPVLLMFQPGEEGYFGAPAMIEEGLLDGAAGTKPLTPDNAKAMAIHIGTEYLSGEIHLKPGAMQASGDNVYITVKGSGGHASAPHTALDPITVAAEIILALQVAITRSVNVFDPAVLTIAHVRSGTTTNIIPETATLEGTFRTVSAERRAMLLPLVERVAAGVAAAHGVEVEVRHTPGYPVTVNDDAVTAEITALATDLVGAADTVTMDAPIMGAEDWSYVLQRIPGAMVFLGARPRDRVLEGYPMNHSNLVVFDEPAMAVGAALYAKAALEL
ncbi:MAG TPA: M20 family metallopeptidase, partial [Candidatus Acidoferrales bacterium]|nr:M20 family metallopeptidase [Candidatus Acidoferrales bacterium]